MANKSYHTQNTWQRLLTFLTPAHIVASTLMNGLSAGHWNPLSNPDELDIARDLIPELEAEGYDFSNIPQYELESILGKYFDDTDYGLLKYHTFESDRFAKDYADMVAANAEMPEAPDIEQYWQDAQNRANQEADESLDTLARLYNDERQSLASKYNTARSDLLSSQYQQNAQLMGTLTSQLDKQQRNALEAGASAGIRLANNVNTLLSAQNKQSQTSLETANQLSQMMVNQRNAEASSRRSYFNEQKDIKDARYGKAQSYFDTEYNIADKAYLGKKADWDTTNDSNPLWETSLGKTKFKNTNTGGTYGH